MISKEGKVKKLVHSVEQISFSGPRAVAQGQEILYVTERCVLRLEPEGVTVVELAPGVDLEARRTCSGRVSAEGGAEAAEDGPGAVSIPSRSILMLHPAREAAPMSAFVELTFEGPLARLTMKRADKLNALDRAMIDALGDAAARSKPRGTPESRSSPARARRSAPAATSPPGAVFRRLRCGATGRAPVIARSRRLRGCAFP